MPSSLTRRWSCVTLKRYKDGAGEFAKNIFRIRSLRQSTEGGRACILQVGRHAGGSDEATELHALGRASV